MWPDVSRHHVDGRLFYADSKAEIADGPTCHFLDMFSEFNAEEWEPKFPKLTGGILSFLAS